MGNIGNIPTPTLDKLSANITERNTIVNFLEWLEATHGVRLGQYHKHTKNCLDEDDTYKCGMGTERLYPILKHPMTLAHEYLELDEKLIEAERRALIDSL